MTDITEFTPVTKNIDSKIHLDRFHSSRVNSRDEDELFGIILGLRNGSFLSQVNLTGLDTWLYLHQNLNSDLLIKIQSTINQNLYSTPDQFQSENINEVLGEAVDHMQKSRPEKSFAQFVGLCRSVCFDNEPDPKKIRFLFEWTKDFNSTDIIWTNFLRNLPVDLTEDKNIDLVYDQITNIVGGTSDIEEMTTRLSTETTNKKIVFQDSRFCFTGTLTRLTRQEASSEVVSRGGYVSDTLSLSTNYLVIGKIANKNWLHSTHGNKIIRAMEFQKRKDLNFNMILEKDFFESISLEELHPDPTPALNGNEISPHEDPGLWIPEFISSENSQKDPEADGLKKKIDHFMKNLSSGEFLPTFRALNQDSDQNMADTPENLENDEDSFDPQKHGDRVICNFIDRLSQANRRSLFINCHPATGKNKIDLDLTGFMDSEFPDKLIQELLTKGYFKGTADLRLKRHYYKKIISKFEEGHPDLDQESLQYLEQKIIKKIDTIDRKLQHFNRDLTQIRKEKGYDVLQVGYPFIWLPEKWGGVYAPLFLWPFSLNHVKAGIWQLEADTRKDRSISQNLPLLDLLADKGLHIEPLSESYLEDGILDSDEITSYINDLSRQIVDLQEAKGERLLSAPSKSHLKKNSIPTIYHTAVLGAFVHHKDSIIKDLQRMNEMSRARSLEFLNETDDKKRFYSKELPHLNPFFSTDFSQREAVKSSISGNHNSIIYGPPGTGKSQVITEILSQSVLNKKSVLVCCDKNTALEVLYRRLASMSLDHFGMLVMDTKRDKLDLFKQIRKNREELSPPSRLKKRHQEKKELLIDEKNILLETSQEVHSHPQYGSFSNHLSELINAKKKLPEQLHDKYNRLKFHTAIESPDDYFSSVKEIHYYFTQSQYPTNIYRKLINLDSNQESIKAISERAKFLKDEIKKYYILIHSLDSKIFFNEKETGQLEKLFPITKLSESSKKYFTNGINDSLAFGDDYFKKIDNIDSSKIKNSFKSDNFIHFHYEKKVNTDELAIIENQCRFFDKFSQKFYYHLIVILYFFRYKNLKKHFLQWGVNLKARENLSVIADDSNLLINFQNLKNTTSEVWNTSEFNAKDFENFESIKLARAEIISKLDIDNLDNLRSIASSKKVREFLSSSADHPQLVESIIKLNKSRFHLIKILSELVSAENLNSFSCQIFDQALSQLKNNDAPDDLKKHLDLFTFDDKYWQRYQDLIKSLNQDLVFIQLVEFFGSRKENQSDSHWYHFARLCYFHFILNIHSDQLNHDHNSYRITNKLRDLPQIEDDISTDQLSQIKSDYVSNLYQNLSQYNIGQIRSMFAVRGKTSKSLRESIDCYQDLLMSFKPIWLTTPDIACSIFPLKKDLFDIVIFDEASQCKTEEAFPVIYRGKTIVVSGDEHQLPPTRFFSRKMETVDLFDSPSDELSEEEYLKLESDQASIEDTDLLTFAQKRNFSSSMLRMHYRSQSPDLIKFSSTLFYKDQLRIIPQVKNNKYHKALYFNQVDGVYSERQNKKEAFAIISCLKNFSKDPLYMQKSIGIVTFNSDQRYLIWDCIDSEMQTDHEFQKFIGHHLSFVINGEDRSLFVKNLEEVQGDERDIILICTTFGLDPKGLFKRNFGPVCQQGGDKRLNVLITRAKKEIHIFTSIPEKEYAQNLDSVLSVNRQRAVFYAYLQYAKSVFLDKTEQSNMILNWVAESLVKSGALESDESIDSCKSAQNISGHYASKISHFLECKVSVSFTIGTFMFDLCLYSPDHSVVVDFSTPYFGSMQKVEEHIDKVSVARRLGYEYFAIDITQWWKNEEIVLDDLKNLWSDLTQKSR